MYRIALTLMLIVAHIAVAEELPPQPIFMPTHADVAYGPHERNVLDVWLAESKQPTPLFSHPLSQGSNLRKRAYFIALRL